MENFKKVFLIFILFFLAFSAKSYSEIVTKVEAKGNERVSLETIVVFGDITIGKNYESPDINLLIKKLYETTFFSNISIELQNGQLSIIVEENPIIDSIVFKGEKAIKYKEAIKELLTLREKTSFVSNSVKSDINKVKEFYRNLGFYFVKIDVEKEELKNNRVNLVYSIDKGKKAKIAKIYFLGDKKIRDKRLRDIITSAEAKFWKFISRNVYLNKGRIELDKRLLKNYYRNRGYYEVEVSSSNVEYAEGEGFILTYSINAGNRYRFKKIFANISKEFDQSAFSSLEKEFNKIIGDYYSQKKLTSILEKIDKLSEQKELQFVNHGVIETLEGDGVLIEIKIFEGQKFIIERINIAGNNVTNDSVIRGEMLVDEGDPFSALLVNKSVNKLRARDIFGAVEAKVAPGSSSDLRILEIVVEEKATGEISAGAGIGTDGTAIMFAVRENNWLGRGIQLQSSIDLSAETLSGSIAATNPNYNFSGNAISGSLSVASTDMTDSAGYTSSRTGFSLGTKFEQYENVFLSTDLSVVHEDIEVKHNATTALKKMDGTFSNIDFSYGIIVDRRNQVFKPTAGYRARFIQSLPIIQDMSSFLNGLDLSFYHGVSDDVIGTLKFFGRSIHGVDDDVRLTNRMYMPATKLRGFNTRKIGPKDGDDFVGGNYVTALGLEAQLPNLIPETWKTDVSVFLDTGNVWHVDYSDTLDDGNKIRSSIGVSANMFTVIGPLSFTLAQSLSKATDDVTESFNFRLGTSF